MYSMRTNFLHFFGLCIILVNCPSFLSQNTSTSPYSSYGLGEMNSVDHAIYNGLGNTTITYFDSTSLNYFNPASYNTMAKGEPLFSTGISSRLSNYNENFNNNFSKVVVLNHFAMGLSFGKYFGLCLGLKPYTQRGYEFSTKELLVTDSIKHTYKGVGSTNEAFIGLSSYILKLKKSHLSVGANLGYVFGTLTDEKRSNITSSTSGGIVQNSLKINSLHYEIGMYYKQKITDKHSYGLAAVIEPNQTFTAYQESNLFTSKFIENEKYYTKLDSTGSIKGKVTLIPSYTFGGSYSFTFKDNKKESQIRNSEISLHTSYSVHQWSNYRTHFGTTETNPNFSNTSKFTIGVQYIPEKSFLGQSTTFKFIEIIRYRAGFYQYTLPVKIGGKIISDKGATIGFGLPIRNQKSLSSLNLGISYGNRGTGVEGMLKETYYGINLSIIFAPASFERWFVKQKLD